LQQERRLDGVLEVEEVFYPEEFLFDTGVPFRLTKADVWPAHTVSPPTRNLNSYLMYVMKFGPILGNSKLAKMQGAV